MNQLERRVSNLEGAIGVDNEVMVVIVSFSGVPEDPVRIVSGTGEEWHRSADESVQEFRDRACQAARAVPVSHGVVVLRECNRDREGDA